MTACTHGMPSPASCVECMEDGNLPPAPRPTVTVDAVFIAYYAGHCRTCNLPTRAGERIARLSNDTYVHAGCTP